MGDVTTAPRCVALVGPYLSGKTSLMEALLFAAGAVNRQGTVKEGNTVGDGSAEARARQQSVEISVANCSYLGDEWNLIDCPGSIEFAQEPLNALMVADMAVVVCEPQADKAQALAPLLRHLDAHAIPHLVFVNKIETATTDLSDFVEALQLASQRKVVLRQLPLLNGESVHGYVDLISERAYAYKPGKASDRTEIPQAAKDAEEVARQELLEALADFDDDLMETLLEDEVPKTADVYAHVRETVSSDQIVPVMIGSAESQHGIMRLWKALRHDTPAVAIAAARRGFAADGDTLLQVFKSMHVPHTGKLSVARIWSGDVKDGATLGGSRIGGLLHLFGARHDKIAQARSGDVVALGRMEQVRTGDVLTAEGHGEGGDPWPAPLSPVYSIALTAERREDEVKLTGALAKLSEEDPSYVREQNADTHQMLLWGQGEIHLTVGIDRLARRFNVAVDKQLPQVAYKETITKSVQQHARHKKQSGGHGQFGDVHVEIRPLARGAGFEFEDSIVGGAVPRQFIPSVEAGVREYVSRGPLGFPVVDFSVKLYDGQFHAVDSSDMAFRQAAQMAMREGMPKCGPVLLEPVFKVSIDVPSDHTSKVTNLVIGRRGQILGFQAKEDWQGWDSVDAYMPQAEVRDLIIELRSLTQGTGTFRFEFDHMSELTGRLADQVVTQRAQADAA